MGKKKRRGKQKDQKQPQLDEEETDNVSEKHVAETLPEAKTTSINNSAKNGDQTNTSAVDNLESPTVASNKDEDRSSQHQGKVPSNSESKMLKPTVSDEKNNSAIPENVPENPPKTQVQPTTDQGKVLPNSESEILKPTVSDEKNNSAIPENVPENPSKAQVQPTTDQGKTLSNTEPEMLKPTISDEKNNAAIPENVPENPSKAQVQPTTDSVTELRTDASKLMNENSSSIDGTVILNKITDCPVSSEISHQQQTSIETISPIGPAGKETEILTQTLGEQSSEKEITNIDEHERSLPLTPENTIPSKNIDSGKTSKTLHREEHKITAKPTEEKPDVARISDEKLTDEGKEKSLTETVSSSPYIPVESGLEETNTKDEGKNNHKTNNKKNAPNSASESVTRKGNKVDEQVQGLNPTHISNLPKKTNEVRQSVELSPLGKEESVEHQTERLPVLEEKSNVPITPSVSETRNIEKKNKKGGANKMKAKVKKSVEEKPSQSADDSEPSKKEKLDSKGEKGNLIKETEPKKMEISDLQKMKAGATSGEKTEMSLSKTQPMEDNKKLTDGGNVIVMEREINVIETSEIKSSSKNIPERKDTENIINVSSTNITGSHEIKGESSTKIFTNDTDMMKNNNQVCNTSSEGRSSSQCISKSHSKETEPSEKCQSGVEPKEQTDIQSSELSIDKIDTKHSSDPSFEGHAEIRTEQPDVKDPSQQQKTSTNVSKANAQSETVLECFVDTNVNTMLSRNKKGTSKQKKNDKKRGPAVGKNPHGNPSDEGMHVEVMNSETVIKEESETGIPQQTVKTKNEKTKKSFGKTAVSQKSSPITKPDEHQDSPKILIKEGEGYSLLHTEGRVPARPVYMANTCHVCKLVHGGSTRLQTCSACRLITYCSKEHQRKHWKEHKSICHVVQNMVRQRGLTDLFSNAHKITDADEWRKFRCILLTEAENHVGRELLPYEREMFLYPRTCGKCHRSDPEKLKVCKLCHYVNFCCNEHIPSNHNIWCQDLKLLLEINQYQSLYGLIKPFIPNFNLNESKQFPNNMKDFIQNCVPTDKNVDLYNLYEALLSDVASYPLTVLYAINYLKERNFQTTLSNKLSIHLVGAESQFEADMLSKWDSFLLNLLHDVVQLNIVFIGPELTANIANEMSSQNYEVRNVKTIDSSKHLVTEFHCGKLYHEYAKEEFFTKPEIICAFNCGIYRFTGFDKQDTWGPTMSSMLKYPNTPIILTAYTAVEAPKDVERFQNQHKIKIVHNTARNPFSSMRPNLNFVSDDETPVIYKNQYISIIVKDD